MENKCPDYYEIEFYRGPIKEKIECAELIESLIKANGIEPYEGYVYGNIIKYLVRCGRKGTKLKDLTKARDYLNEMISIVIFGVAFDDDEQQDNN